MKSAAISSPGIMPANQSFDTGCRAIMPYSTSTTDGGMRMPRDEPPCTTPEISTLS